MVIGTLYVESLRLMAFTKEEAVLLESFADQAAVAIENAKLYKRIENELQEKMRELGPRIEKWNRRANKRCVPPSAQWLVVMCIVSMVRWASYQPMSIFS